MPHLNLGRYAIPAVAAILSLVIVVGFGLIRRARRQPCPHCGRKAPRVVLKAEVGPTGLRPQAIVYACRACGGTLRYARRPNGQEYWEPVGAHPGQAI